MFIYILVMISLNLMGLGMHLINDGEDMDEKFSIIRSFTKLMLYSPIYYYAIKYTM